jgi:hypothetical protein
MELRKVRRQIDDLGSDRSENLTNRVTSKRVMKKETKEKSPNLCHVIDDTVKYGIPHETAQFGRGRTAGGQLCSTDIY